MFLFDGQPAAFLWYVNIWGHLSDIKTPIFHFQGGWEGGGTGETTIIAEFERVRSDVDNFLKFLRRKHRKTKKALPITWLPLKERWQRNRAIEREKKYFVSFLYLSLLMHNVSQSSVFGETEFFNLHIWKQHFSGHIKTLVPQTNTPASMNWSFLDISSCSFFSIAYGMLCIWFEIAFIANSNCW